MKQIGWFLTIPNLYFTRIAVIRCPYFIYDRMLETVSSIKEVAVIFDTKVLFNLRITFVVGKVRASLDFIESCLTQFEGPYILKGLFMALLRSI